MRQYITLLVTTSIALFAPACGGDDGGGAGSTVSSGFMAALQAQCDKAFECKDSYDASMHNDKTFESTYGNSSEDCYNKDIALIYGFAGADFFDKLDASQSAGRIDYSPSDTQVCLDAAASGESCDAFFKQNNATYDAPPECDTAIQGTVATGDACTTDLDCMVDGDKCSDTNVCAPG